MAIVIDTISDSVEYTIDLAGRFSKELGAGDVVCLFGVLGSGKTSFVKGIARGLNCLTDAKSPSYSLINEYPGKVPLIHIDFYRIDSIAEIEDLGWSDYLESNTIICIEWPEKILNYLPHKRFDVFLEITDESHRTIRIFKYNDIGNR